MTDPIPAARALIEYLSAEQEDEAAQVVATLADAVEAERAKVAAAYEAAACVIDDPGNGVGSVLAQQLCCDGHMCGCQGATISDYLQHIIRALTPANAQAALDKLLAEARLEGWRAGRDAAADACVLSGKDLAEGDWGPEGRDMAVMLEARIRALLEPKENSHD